MLNFVQNSCLCSLTSFSQKGRNIGRGQQTYKGESQELFVYKLQCINFKEGWKSEEELVCKRTSFLIIKIQVVIESEIETRMCLAESRKNVEYAIPFHDCVEALLIVKLSNNFISAIFMWTAIMSTSLRS